MSKPMWNDEACRECGCDACDCANEGCPDCGMDMVVEASDDEPEHCTNCGWSL